MFFSTVLKVFQSADLGLKSGVARPTGILVYDCLTVYDSMTGLYDYYTLLD